MDAEGLEALIDLLEEYGWEIGLPIADEEDGIKGYIIGDAEYIEMFTDSLPELERDEDETLH